MNALTTATAPYGSIDATTPGVAAVDIAGAAWHRCLADVLTAGGTYLDFISAADLGSGTLQVVAHIRSGAGAEHVLVRTTIAAGDAHIDSVGDVWSGATWHEREVSDLFGITFGDSTDDRPLLTDRQGPAPLLKSTLLQARQDVDWPGSFDPADKPGSAVRLPLGVPDAPSGATR